MKKILLIVIPCLCAAAIICGIMFFVPFGSDFTVKDDICIDTKYCTLHYPEKWKDNLEIKKITEGDDCSVEFYGKSGDHKEQLFTVDFGKSEGFSIGSIITDDKKTVTVSVGYADFVPDETWSKKDSDTLAEMQEGVNYIMEKLNNEKSFKASE